MSAGTGVRPPLLSPQRAQLAAFAGLCSRDLWVIARRDLAGFLAQSLLQPFFYLFIFGRVLPEIGAASDAYGEQLLPGVLALTLALTALQNTALPLVIEFSFTKEIEDRLLAPLPAWAVGLQKMVMASLRGIVAAILIIPLAAVVLPDGVQLGGVEWLGVVALALGGSLAGAAIGLVMGTAVQPTRINVVFAVVLTPLLFTGCTFYPWQSLETLPWFQVVTLFNPLTYISEGLRGAMTTSPHLGAGWVALGLLGSIVVFTAWGLFGFVRRAVD
jgi:ABC-2 type transport system permease protein